MFHGPPQRFVVDLSPVEVMERIEAHTQPEFEGFKGRGLFAGLMANQQKHLDRAFNLRFVARLQERSFEIEASGQAANQMGMLKGVVTPWGNRSIIDARYAPNRYVWVTVVNVVLFGTVGALFCIGLIVAPIIGVLQYNRARYSKKVLAGFLPHIFADVMTREDAAAAELNSIPRAFDAPRSAESQADYEIRTFSDASGQFEVAATMHNVVAGQGGGAVQLQGIDGKRHNVPMHQLSADDQQWVHRETKRRERIRVEANKRLAWRRSGIILGVFLCIFLATFGCMGCAFVIPFLDFFSQVSR